MERPFSKHGVNLLLDLYLKSIFNYISSRSFLQTAAALTMPMYIRKWPMYIRQLHEHTPSETKNNF